MKHKMKIYHLDRTQFVESNSSFIPLGCEEGFDRMNKNELRQLAERDFELAFEIFMEEHPSFLGRYN